MTEDERIELFLTRAADVTPASTRPTDDVLLRADQKPFARMRRHARVLIGGVVGCGLVAGGAVALSTGDEPAPPPAPPPLRLTVDLPPGWRYDDSGLALTCASASTLVPLTVYRGATIGDLRCPAEQMPTVAGPVLVAGRLEPALAERVRTSGSPTSIGTRQAWVEPGGDAPYAFATYLVGGTDDIGYAVVAPHGAGPEKLVVPSLQGEDVWSVPVEALAAGSRVRIRGGERLTQHRLPDDVRAVVLPPEAPDTGAALGGLIWSQSKARQILQALRPAKRQARPCDRPIRARTLWLQRLEGSWVRVDVTTDAAGCQAGVSELGGSARVVGDPVALARVLDEGERRNNYSADSGVERAGVISFPVPDGWQVWREPTFDPCTAKTPTVVLSERVAPSCLMDVGQRAYQPFLWLTARPLEELRSTTDSGVPLAGRPRQVAGRDGVAIAWSQEMLVVDDVTLQGWLGIPAKGTGRLLLMGVPFRQGATGLQVLAGST